MLFINQRRVVVSFVAMIAISSLALPASYAVGAEQGVTGGAGVQAARIAAKMTPAQMAVIAKLNPRELALLARLDRSSLSTIAKMDPSTLRSVAKMDNRAFGVASKIDRRSLASIAKMDRNSLNSISKMDNNTIQAMAKIDSKGGLKNAAVRQSVTNFGNKTKEKKKNSFF